MVRSLRRALALVVVLLLPAGAAHAYDFKTPLRPGGSGRDVRALQIRIAGWYPERSTVFKIDGRYGDQTAAAVRRFKEAYELKADEVAGRSVLRTLEDLEDRDGSTEHFNWGEFAQNSSSTCSAKANAYADTLRGGAVSPRRTRMYVRRLMWRLEAIRKKAGGKGIAINSGFRSVPYNDCIGGARASQHMYGTAADARQAHVTNRRQRRLAKKSQFHGIGCYSSQTHNHLDLRIDNRDLPSQRQVWWPDRDGKGRDLDEAGVPCWGETTTSTKRAALSRTLRSAVSLSIAPSADELARFAAAGETLLAPGAD